MTYRIDFPGGRTASTIPHHTTPYHTTPHHTTPYNTIPHRTTLHHTTSHNLARLSPHTPSSPLIRVPSATSPPCSASSLEQTPSLPHKIRPQHRKTTLQPLSNSAEAGLSPPASPAPAAKPTRNPLKKSTACPKTFSKSKSPTL